MMDIYEAARISLGDVVLFAEMYSGLRLRSYQREAAQAIVDSVIHQRGKSFVVLFPRQSGKNELQAQIEVYLLTILRIIDAEMVKVSPTWKPQSLNAMRRLERVLKRNPLTCFRWQKESGYIFRVGQARIFFLSGGPTANVVGATASTLLECDEAQDITIEKWDKDFAPMAASTNATRVFWGTCWTSKTLLARELRSARAAEQKDGQRRVFIMDANQVAAEVPPYGQFVAEQIAKLGRNHPFVKTQYFSEEIDAESSMFPAARLALMRGDHPPEVAARPGCVYAMLLDLAGEDESASDELVRGDGNLSNPGRDSTAMTIVEVDLSSLADELIKAPTYRIVFRHEWTGTKHTNLYSQIKAMAETYQVRYLVVDATGVGAGLASFLAKAMPNQVIPFIFTSKSKSDLGWGFLSVIETGRYKEYSLVHPGRVDPGILGIQARLQEAFFNQVSNCQSSIQEGPAKLMRWGVPDGSRDPASGELLHDDLLISAALCSVLDSQPWGLANSQVIPQADPLAALKEAY
jgi:hypothetical protein